MDYDYLFDAGLIDTLEKIIFYYKDPAYKMSFVVSCRSKKKGILTLLTATFDFFGVQSSNRGIRFNFYDQTRGSQLEPGDEVFTSIQLHCPKFNFDK